MRCSFAVVRCASHRPNSRAENHELQTDLTKLKILPASSVCSVLSVQSVSCFALLLFIEACAVADKRIPGIQPFCAPPWV